MINETEARPLLEAQDLVYSYATGSSPAVNGVSFDVKKGQVVALIGPNGSGKTTTLAMLTGQLFPQKGEVRVEGFAMGPDALEARRRIGFVPDRPDLYEYLTGRQYVRYVAGMYGVRAQDSDRLSEKWWDRFDLTEARDQLLKTYSHGMRQRVVIISVLTHDPSLLILDEPIVGLDPQSARSLRDVVRERADNGGGVLFSTHLLSIAAQVADSVVMIQEGRVRARGTVDELRLMAGKGPEADLEEVFFTLLHGREAWTELKGGT